MRRIILSALALVATLTLSAQTKVFCEIVEQSKYNKKVKIIIDFGQEREKSKNKQTIVDESGNPIQFNSKIDALNYMSTLGWEFVQAYTITRGSNGDISSEIHWILSKESSDKEDTYKGIVTKEAYDKAQNK